MTQLRRQTMVKGLKVPSLAPYQQDREYLGSSKNIKCHVVQMEYSRLCLGPIEEEDVDGMMMDETSYDPQVLDITMDFTLLTNLLTGPLTVLDIGHNLVPDLSTKKDLTVHFAGASYFEMVAMLKWKYLAHRLPALDRLDYAFAGPELEQGGRKKGMSSIDSCPECQELGKSISYREFTGLYQDFSNSEGFSQPDILIVQNCCRIYVY